MVETITPVVHGGSRRKWGTAVASHALGAALSAAALGAALGWSGAALGAPWGVIGLLALGVVGAVYAARDLLGLPVPIPERRRQVPEHWRWRYGTQVASFLYGLGLGIGFLTHVRHGTLVAVSVAAAVTGDPLLGALVMAPFGLARGISLLVTARARTSEALREVAERLDRVAASRLPGLANGAALLAVTALAGLAAARTAGLDAQPLLAASLGGVFAWAAAAKVVAPGRWREALVAYRLGVVERPALVGAPLAEAAVVILVLMGVPAHASALALALLGAFSGAILRARGVHGRRLPCGCFGGSKARDVRVLLARNLLLGLLATAVLVTGASLPLVHWARTPAAGELLPASLAVAGLSLALWLTRRAAATLRREPG
jgi:hypothetical protein